MGVGEALGLVPPAVPRRLLAGQSHESGHCIARCMQRGDTMVNERLLSGNYYSDNAKNGFWPIQT
jgi:hypothetical protein